MSSGIHKNIKKDRATKNEFYGILSFRTSIFLYVFMNTQYISVRQSNFTFQDHPQYPLMSHSSP